MILIGYWNLTNPPKNGYKQFPREADSQILKEAIFPGKFGFPDLYIRHIRFVVSFKNATEEMMIISQTERELTESDQEAIMAGAINFLTNPPDEPA